MKYIASSKPYYIKFQNQVGRRNHLTATASANHNPNDQTIVIYKGNGSNRKLVQTITGKVGEVTSANSFNIGANQDECLLSLSECLKINDLFTNVEVILSESGQHVNSIEADMDNSERYTIEIQSTNTPSFYIVGDFQGKTDSTFTLNYSTNDANFSQTKTTDLEEVRFDIASPWQTMTFKYPIEVNVNAHKKSGNKFQLLAVGESNYVVMPSTLSLYEECDYSDYIHDGTATKKEWLTRNLQREYNYGEVCCLSFLGKYQYRLWAKWFTNAGVLLTEGEPTYYVDTTSTLRQDYYFDLQIHEKELLTSRQIGYVEVSLRDYNNNEITTKPVRYDINPRCHNNLEIFFVNAIGGVDSFNGWIKFGVETSIGDLSTFNINQMKDDSMFTHNDVAQYEVVHKKSNQNKYTLTTAKLKRNQVEWLRELQRSKYAYIRLGDWDSDDARYQMVIIDNMTVNDDSTTSDYTLSVTFHDYSNSLKF